MRRPARVQQRLLAAAVCLGSAGVLAGASGAETQSSTQRRAEPLPAASGGLATRPHALRQGSSSPARKVAGSSLGLSALLAEGVRIGRERASARRQLAAARTSLRAAQRGLALRLHALYQRRGNDPFAVLLGAASVRDAIDGLDELKRSAQLNARIAAQAQRARVRVQVLTRLLAKREARLREVVAAAERRVARLGAAAEPAGQQTATRRPSPAPARVRTRAAAAAGRTLTVVATGYSVTGPTASGIPAGAGIVAVDPAVIPLGTHMTIPGYGEGVAADTGPSLRGAAIDLWFPTVRQALVWGRKTIIVTLH